METVPDIHDPVVPHGVAGHVNDRERWSPNQDEANHWTPIRLRGTVASRSGGQVDSAGQLHALPRVETGGVSAETCRGSRRGVDHARVRQQGTTCGVEIIEVVIMAEEDGVKRLKRFKAQRRPLGLSQGCTPLWGMRSPRSPTSDP